MAGQVHTLIDKLVQTRAKGNQTVANMVRTKLLLKGIKAQDWTPASQDDAEMLTRLRTIAKEMGVAL